ncbi:AMP-binding protein [Brumicola pallidula]|jgi:crotonobetaine/carnitine-CoA ligase|uniref:Crotonobetaine/carnitine-CoA ligase n=1 Tax=Brumicola pallidula DSM 14239 = ACAM 615 TaxID=1121922 RepID=K6Y313_9ALTE|nr:AMP-binding protein [Glaciecola pallidula]GAC27204.1 crotonobetaine/carnitine-CoA ligase [Glaciecola pallidula DSM 14239 = ACAM 615]
MKKSDFYDPRIPDRDQCVVRYLINRWAQETPDKVYVQFEDGDTWTYAELKERVVRAAVGFQKLGVQQGETVAVWLPNGPDALLAFYALNYIGAIFVPFNTAFCGNMLHHVIDNSDAKIIVVHKDLVPRLTEIDLAKLKVQILCGGTCDTDTGLESHIFDDLKTFPDELMPLVRAIEPWDPQSIIYTSGTTGPSKGVLSSYLHMYSNAGPESWPMVTREDRYLVAAPFFHIGGMAPPFVMLVRGASFALLSGFSTDTFWAAAKQSQATVVFLLGVMATFLMKQPPSSNDKEHGVMKAFMVPLSDDAPAFTERFGIDIYTIFNMTEISSPIVSEPNPTVRGTCGKVRPGVDVRLVDGNDCEIPVGQVGEMIIRTDRPWGMNSGYYKNSEATAEAWRNGWFHTGDAFRQNEDGYFYFVDRIKDAIRRRGENISSFEVEVEVCSHPAIREAAAIGVPSEATEDDVMVIIALVEHATIELTALCEFLVKRMPYYMVPRYIRIVDALPKTPTQKVQKAQLRSEGVTTDTWDRDKSGLRLKREVLKQN